ncbi:MAG: CarD family transcriptional regulator, partial [Abditibacteriales bacterium]|nr:CarD family transcriptional regulator [Abditibacteriales bacterium]
MRSLLSLANPTSSFHRLTECLQAKHATIAQGVPRAARAFVLAALQQAQPHTMLVVTPTPETAEELAGDLEAWLLPAEEDSKDVPARLCYLFPTAEWMVSDAAAVDVSAVKERLEVLERLAAVQRSRGSRVQGVHAPHEPMHPTDCVIVVCSLAALCHPTLPPDLFHRGRFGLKQGEACRREDLIEALVDAGYERVPTVERVGQFSVRGGIVDVFPPSAPQPFRVELLGDEIDSIRTFDLNTQRSTALVASCLISPPREVILTQAVVSAAVPRLKDALNLRLNALRRKGLTEEARNLEAIVARDVEKLQALSYFEGVERYTPFLYPHVPLLLDYLPEDALIVLVEPTQLEMQHRRMVEDVNQLLASKAERGELLLPTSPPPLLIKEGKKEVTTTPLPPTEGQGQVLTTPPLTKEGQREVPTAPLLTKEGQREVPTTSPLTKEGQREVPTTPLLTKEGPGEVPTTPLLTKEGPGEVTARYPLPTLADIAARCAGKTVLMLTAEQGEQGAGKMTPLVNVPPTCSISFQFHLPPSFGGRLDPFLEQVRHWQRSGQRIVLATNHSERLREILRDGNVPSVTTHEAHCDAGVILLAPRRLSSGFLFPDACLILLTNTEIFGWMGHHKRRRHRDSSVALRAIEELQAGDYVVHVQHGIGIYRGVVRQTVAGAESDYVLIQYAGADRLYVPVQQLDRIQRYVGAEGYAPPLNSLGGRDWENTKRKVREATREVAQELARLYAAREEAEGTAFSPDTPWQREMEASFDYEETPDQL